MKKILIIGKVWPEAKSSAAGTRMMQLIHFFLRQKCEVVFVCAAKKSGFEEDLDALNIENHFITLNCDSFNTILREINPTDVLYDRFMTEEQFGWRVRKELPNAFEILNTEDLHFLREARKTAVQKNEQIDAGNIRNEILYRELAALLRCDKTLLVSTFEKDLLEKHYQINSSKLIYYPVLINELIKNTIPFEQRKDFLFIGNFYHAPNWDALLYLKNEIWPVLRKKIPGAKLHIYGAYATEKVTRLQNIKENFIVHGRVEDALEVTKNIRVALAPLRFGAGIKGKILEALTCETPFVTTEIGAEAMLNEGFDFSVGKNTEDFIEKAVELYLQEKTWCKAKVLGTQLAKENYSYTHYENKLSQDLLNGEKSKNEGILADLIAFHSNKHYTYFSKWIANKN
ncbi:MAG: glycosyltransferase family 4 protein [Lishizhenia sp.]